MEQYLVKTPLINFNRSPARQHKSNKSFSAKKPTLSTKSNDENRKCRLSILDTHILKILSSQPDEPLINSTKENLSSPDLDNKFHSNENISPNGGYFMHPNNAKQQTLTDALTRTWSNFTDKIKPAAENKLSQKNDIQSSNEDMIGLNNHLVVEEKLSPKRNPILERLQRDLNSPSAASRFRALKAIRSPAKSSYNIFDIPYEEQDIITEEERKQPKKAKSIQELLKDVVVYVEVRTAEDNRSAGVKQVISELGAKINDKFLRNTTHVVFKDGLQSTYNKAKKWNIPLVSILWIEACKKHMAIINPTLFPIFDKERYENPELYKKVRRQRSMQPNAEEKNTRKKKTVLDKNNKLNNPNNMSSLKIPRKPKDKLNEILSGFHEKLLSSPENSEDCLPLDSKLLERSRNPPSKKLQNAEQIKTKNRQNESFQNISSSSNEDEVFEDINETKTPTKLRPYMLFSNKEKEINQTPNSSVNKTLTKITSSTKKNVQNVAKDSKNFTVSSTLNKSNEKIKEKNMTKNKRRTICSRNLSPNLDKDILNKSDKMMKMKMNKSNEKIKEKDITKNKRRTICSRNLSSNLDKDILNKSDKMTEEDQNKLSIDKVNRTNRRQTSFTSIPLELSTSTPVQRNIKQKSTTNRRSLFTPKNMELTKLKESNISNKRRQTLFTPTTMESIREKSNYIDSSQKDLTTIKNSSMEIASSLIEEYEKNNQNTFNSYKKPVANKRRTLFDISMDIIEQRLHNINKSVKQNQNNSNSNITTNMIQSKNNSINHNELNDKIDEIELHNTPKTTNTSINNDNIKNVTNLNETPLQLPKKRKLFTMNDTEFTPIKNCSPLNKSNGNKRKLISENILSTTKNQKSLNNTSNSLINNISIQSNKKLKSDIKETRRSTLDFETVKNIKVTTSAIDSDKKKMSYLVYTNMHSPQIDFIKETVRKLNGFELEDTVNDKTTHLVSLEPRRTLNILRALIRGLWILNYNWILDSAKYGKWLPEEEYELREFSPAVEICRSERQAFGSGYKVDLFSAIDPIFVSNISGIPAKSIKELILLCSGKVVENRRKAKYLVGETSKIHPEKIFLSSMWILDSITEMKIKKIRKYLLKE